MTELLASLASIALVDTLSMTPVAVVPLALLLGGRRPVAGTLAFIAGIFVTYYPFGVLMLFGLDTLFDGLAKHFSAWWQQAPDFGEVVLQIVVGLVMIGFGQRLCSKAAESAPKQGRRDMGPAAAFALAAVINVSGLWGALPYFAAIAQILKADPTPAGMLAALLFYSLVFVLPLGIFLLLYLLFGARAERWVTAFGDLLARWGGRLLVVLLFGLGFLLVVDGIGWLRGTPLIVPALAQ